MYEELCKVIKERSGMDARETTVTKGGVRMTGIAVGNNKICPTIYPKNFGEMPVEELADKIIQIAKDAQPDEELADIVSNLTTWHWAKDRMVICVRPHTEDSGHITRQFLNLEQYVRVKIGDDKSVVVSESLCKSWGKTPEEVFESASIEHHRVGSLASMLSGDFADVTDFDNCPMLVVTNDSRYNGANALLDNALLDDIAHKLSSSFYILPSSIHEVLVIPYEDGIDVRSLKEMVMTVNREEVKPEEQLSDNVYEYRDGKLSIAA